MRAGGLTKDAIYLRGLIALLEHLSCGGELAALLVGKLALVDLPVVVDLLDRGVLEPPRLVPRYLDGADAAARLSHVRGNNDLVELTWRTT